jgi:tetratricopeptide (TPR) repeat protein
MKKLILIILNLIIFKTSYCQNITKDQEFCAKGSIAELAGDYEKSIAYMDSAIAINPNNHLYYSIKAEDYYNLENYKNAIFFCNKSISLNAKNDIYFIRALSKSKLEDYRGAIEDYTKVVPILIQLKEKNARIAEAFTNRAGCKLAINKTQEAIIDCNTALKYDKEFSRAYYAKGIAYISIDDIENGCKNLTKAGELGLEEAYELIKEYCK